MTHHSTRPLSPLRYEPEQLGPCDVTLRQDARQALAARTVSQLQPCLRGLTRVYRHVPGHGPRVEARRTKPGLARTGCEAPLRCRSGADKPGRMQVTVEWQQNISTMNLAPAHLMSPQDNVNRSATKPRGRAPCNDSSCLTQGFVGRICRCCRKSAILQQAIEFK